MISETQWEIIKLLTKKDRTPTEISEKLKKSMPTIYNSLKNMESLNLIKKVEEKKGKTRPYTNYSIGKGFVYFMEAVPGMAMKKFISVDKNLKMHLNIWSIPQKEFHYYIEKFWWILEDFLDTIKAVAVFGSVAIGKAKADSDIDILILSSSPKIIDKKFGAIAVGKKGKQKMVMSQVFKEKEFENILKKKSKLALEITKTMKIIYDPDKILSKWK